MKGVKDLIISEEGRKILSMPIGIVIYKEPSDALEILRDLVDNYNPPLIITVGDVVTGNLLKRKFKVNIAILDGKTLRKEIIEYKYIIDTYFCYFDRVRSAGVWNNVCNTNAKFYSSRREYIYKICL